jgi:hypothetical protein
MLEFPFGVLNILMVCTVLIYKFSPFKNECSLQPFELEIGRHIAWNGTNNRAK